MNGKAYLKYHTQVVHQKETCQNREMASSSSSSSSPPPPPPPPAASVEAELRKGFETLEVVQKDRSIPVYHIYLNRPAQLNALSLPFFSDLPRALSLLDRTPSARAIVLSARGPHFCAGIDLSSLSSLTSPNDDVTARIALRRYILSMQSAISAVELCRKPVITAVHGACIGGGVDLIAACDLRYCTADAFFSVKEVDMALTADLGSLQRLPAIVGYGRAMDLALTGREVRGLEAREMGLVSAVYGTREEMEKGVDGVARALAAKAAVAVTGTKAVMLRSRDLSVELGLDYVATWNAGVLVNRDLEEAVRARREKRKPVFTCKI